MKVVIIEDEKIAAGNLTRLLQETEPGIEILDVITSVKDSVSALPYLSPDLIFLDIQLSDGISFTIFESVNVNAPVIFTTAYDDYAIRAFKLNSIDYLLKPIKKSELVAAIHKYKSMRDAFLPDINKLLSLIPSNDKSGYKRRFLIQFGEKMKKVTAGEIAYFYAIGKNVFLVTEQGSTYPVDSTLEKLETETDPDAFFRINRKLLISYESIIKITPFSRSRIMLELRPALPKDIEAIVSIERVRDFRNWMER